MRVGKWREWVGGGGGGGGGGGVAANTLAFTAKVLPGTSHIPTKFQRTGYQAAAVVSYCHSQLHF